MAEVKHTPGPWRVDVNGSENWTVDYEGPSSTYMAICANGRREPVGFAVDPSAWGNDEEIEANARLFAAAPDLFEALRKSAEGWANALELGLIPPQHRDTATLLRDEAQAALSKATAQQEGR